MRHLYSIDASSQGESLRNFIKKKHSEFSTRDIEALLSRNGCKRNQLIERFGSTKLNKGDIVEIFPHFLQKKKLTELPILFNDDDLIIIDKPEGVASSESELEPLLKQKIMLVHRLDKATSGILILAKTERAKEALEKLFFDRQIDKTYLAIVQGPVAAEEGIIDRPLRLKKRYEGGVIYHVAPFGMKALTEWKRLARSAKESFLMLKPHTGKTHQLRVHLEFIGHPILGDPIYGLESRSSLHVERLMLHARRVEFIHPFTNKRVEIIASIPIIIRQTLAKLFKKISKCAF